jgi:hypothetical protein
MKKSTGILFLVALALAGLAYFYESKHSPAKDDQSAASQGVQPAFTIKPEDVTQVTLTRAGTAMVCDLKIDGWHISQPVDMRADQSAMGDMINALTELPEDRTIKNVSASDLNTYGLVNPRISVAFTLKNGTKHSLQIGGKDFSNLEVYAFVDGSKDVALISNVIMSSIDKPVEEFRDHSVMAINPLGVSNFELSNASGTMSAQKDDAGWKFVKPLMTPGSTGNISDLFNNLSMELVSGVVNDSSSDLAKYGLANPAIRLRVASADGASRELIIGNKQGDKYYAADPSQQGLFLVQQSVHALLSQSFGDLRAKTLLAASDDSVARVEVHNQNGATACAKDATGNMVVQQAPGQTGTPAACPDFAGTLERTSSSKIYDQPPANLSAKLVMPAISITVTDVAGKKIDIQISAASGSSVYGRTSSSGATIYEFDKQLFDDLNAKPSTAK